MIDILFVTTTYQSNRVLKMHYGTIYNNIIGNTVIEPYLAYDPSF